MQEKTTDISIVNQNDVENLIYTVRGQKVMLDVDLAKIYGYETKTFNQQVKRNIERFPADMMFQLNDDEVKELSRSQFVTLNKTTGRGKNIKYNPYAFTEQGIYMLMTVLKGELAVKQGITAIIFSDNIGNMLRRTDYNDFVTQYGSPQITFQKTSGKFHDRYIILDYKTKAEKIYHCGASSKDAGKKITSITLVDDYGLYHSMVEDLLQNPLLVLN